MNRRRLLIHGTSLLPLTLSGCLSSTKSSPESTTQTTTTESTTQTDSGYEDLFVRNGDSTAHSIHIRVTRTSKPEEPLVNARYRIPSKTILEFPPLLKHGTKYRIAAIPPHQNTTRKTLTVEGCTAPSGDRPVIISVTESEPRRIFHLDCDVGFTTRGYTYRDSENHKITTTTTEAETPVTTTE
jgi:hypothetical protein